ncbi:ninein-like protein isoform X3 [Kryptolebias marmoratus]|uniref:ninein-like protein isoform X3 n=1 Tax=Kryptolebias marmoratus TaxID=37003 RepID=UPI0018AC97C0|nr:ninein-like protein isoform X3 [Kryptolebias marmoratus]
MEEEAEHSRYVDQLKAEFNSCDTTATGFLDRDELTELCRKLQLDAHLPLLLTTLLGEKTYGRVNFEEFKEGFVTVLSQSLDFSTSEDSSSYLEPAAPEEVKPKFIKGTKRYGRRSHPDSKPDAALTCDLENSPQSRTKTMVLSLSGICRAKLGRSTSLESVESLKSDEETGSNRNVQQLFQTKEDPQQQQQEQQQEEEEDRGDHQDVLLQRLAPNLHSTVIIREFRKVLSSSAPTSSSTPIRSADLQRAPYRTHEVLEEVSAHFSSPSLLTATVGQRVLSRLDDGTGYTSPDRVAALWTEEGIRNSKEILQTLDFPLDERLSLVDLTLALDNELLVSGNGIHQVALISYKNEIQHLHGVLEQASRERDKLRVDLDLANQRILQLVREVDDRHANMETLNESRIRDLEQDFQDRLTSLRSQSVQENEALLQQVDRECRSLQEELQLVRVQEAELQEELSSAAQENLHLEEELDAVKIKLNEAESLVNRLQGDLKQLLHHKFGSLDPTGATLSHEEKFCEIIEQYERQCRELQDRNDELSTELELLRSQKSSRKSKRPTGNDADASALSWSQQLTESDSEDSDMKRSSSPVVRKKLQPVNKTALSSLDDISGPAVSIQTELAVEQLKEKHQQELQQLNIQLETQMNYYERQLEKMKDSMEVERKDISQAFKLEISELEEQRTQAEHQVKQLKESVDKLQTQIQYGGSGRSNEMERRVQRERAELEQNFAREISNLVQKLSSEKDQLEAELKLKMDQEVMHVREESKLLLTQVKQQHLHQLHQEQQDLKTRMEQEVCRLQEVLQRFSQSEASIKMEMEVSWRRCLELEARLEESCTQLEESISYLETQKVLNKRLVLERSSMEEELQQIRRQEEELQVQVHQLREELQVQNHQEKVDGCRSSVQLQTVSSLKSELETLQEVLTNRSESVSGLTVELDSLKTDRARLIQDLKDQGMAMDNLQLQLDLASEELNRGRSSEACLQEALKQEQNRASQIWSSLAEERQELARLDQENRTYIHLVDQLSTQIVEMEEEISSLRNHLKDLSLQLNDTADLVLDLRKQLNSKTSELDRLRAEGADRNSLFENQNSELKRIREQVLFLQQALQDSQNQFRTHEEDFDREKRKMVQQLMELEKLVLDLEDMMELNAPHRTQLEEVRSENGALQERLRVLQQDVQNLEDDVVKKRRRLEEMDRECERSREEEERLHKENSKYREEVLDMSSRNLQLSNDNSDLISRLHEEQESVRILQHRLEMVSKEQEEDGFAVRRLQEAALQENKLLEKELSTFKEKLGRHSQLEAELNSVTVKLQTMEEEKKSLQRDAEDRNHKVEKLQQQVISLQDEAELLRSQLLTATQEKLGHAQEVTELRRKLQEVGTKMEQLKADVRRLMKEEEETNRLRVQNKELYQQLSELQVQHVQVQKLTQEQQNLKFRLNEVEAARTQAQDQAVRADATLSVVKAQHLRQVQQLQQQASSREQVEVLQAYLEEETRRSQQLEEAMKLQVQQSSSQIIVKQEQYEKATAAQQQRVEELEVQLKGLRLLLQEKIQQFKDQLVKNNKANGMLKDLYVENSQLMKVLQVTEQRQKQAEKKNFQLEERVGALNKLLREAVATALAT